MNELKKKLLKKALKSIEYSDVGVSFAESSIGPEPQSEKHYPSFSVSAEAAPFLDDFDVGDVCSFVVKAKIVSHDISDGYQRRDDYRLEIKEIGKFK